MFIFARSMSSPLAGFKRARADEKAGNESLLMRAGASDERAREDSEANEALGPSGGGGDGSSDDAAMCVQGGCA